MAAGRLAISERTFLKEWVFIEGPTDLGSISVVPIGNQNAPMGLRIYIRTWRIAY